MRLLVAYEFEHVPVVVKEIAQSKEPCVVLALSYWIDMALREQGIEPLPLTSFVPTSDEQSEQLRQCMKLSQEWHRLPQMSFFNHKGVMLGQPYEPALTFYFQQVMYMLGVLERAIAATAPLQELIVPRPSAKVSEYAGFIAAPSLAVIEDVATFLGHTHNIPVRLVGGWERLSAVPFPQESRARRMLLTLYNAAISLAPRRAVKVYASEYWKNIASLVKGMPDLELVLMDRSQFRSIPLRELIRHRIRFVHPLDVGSKNDRKRAHTLQESIRTQWREAKDAVRSLSGFTAGTRSIWSIVEPVLDQLVTVHAERVLFDTEVFVRIYVRECFDKILVRSSTGQLHFAVMAAVARTVGIPSIELLHGAGFMFYEEPEYEFTTDYMAAYGPSCERVLERRIAHAKERIRAVGSPRFDGYISQRHPTKEIRRQVITQLGLDPERPVVLVGMPAVSMSPEYLTFTPALFNSYEIEAMLQELHRVAEAVPDIQYIFKFRSYNQQCWDLIKKIFPRNAIATHAENFFTLATFSDVVLAGNSTVVYEALIAQKPLILYPVKGHDRSFKNFHARAFPIPETTAALASALAAALDVEGPALRAKGVAFLAEEFSFDGHASERIALLLREPLHSFET